MITSILDQSVHYQIIIKLPNKQLTLFCLRAYQRQGMFQQRFHQDLNANVSSRVVFSFANMWFMMRMDLIGMIAIVVTGIFSVGLRGAISPAAAGLAMANAMMTGTFLPFIMRMKAEFRGRFNSVERIYDYTVRILYRTGTWE